MSDEKKEQKPKRGYMVGGESLCYNLRVRLDAETAQRLAERAKRDGATKADIARQILKDGLSPKK